MKYTFELLSRGVLPWKDDEAIWRWGRPRQDAVVSPSASLGQACQPIAAALLRRDPSPTGIMRVCFLQSKRYSRPKSLRRPATFGLRYSSRSKAFPWRRSWTTWMTPRFTPSPSTMDRWLAQVGSCWTQLRRRKSVAWRCRKPSAGRASVARS